MLPNEKWIIIQPTHQGGQLSLQSMPWTNDSFRMLSKQFDAPCFHILDENIPLDADAYIICSFDINLIEKEIEFTKKVQANGAKVLVGFSQDLRFLTGGALLNHDGFMYTSLCEVADVISSGLNPELGIYGRFQDKVIPLGEIIEDENWSVPIEEKIYDLISCEAVSEYTLGFELEFMLLVKERHPDHKLACIIAGQHLPLIETLRNKYHQLEFPYDPLNMPNLLSYIKKTKVFCNPEIRPRPCRTAMESYYCRVPFISSKWTYHSNICPDYTYRFNDIVEMADKYDLILSRNRNEIIKDMEEKAKYDHFENVYKRIKEKMFK